MAAKKKIKQTNTKTPVAKTAPDVPMMGREDCAKVGQAQAPREDFQYKWMQNRIDELERKANRYTSVKVEQMKRAASEAYQYWDKLNILISAIQNNPSIEDNVQVPSYPRLNN